MYIDGQFRIWRIQSNKLFNPPPSIPLYYLQNPRSHHHTLIKVAHEKYITWYFLHPQIMAHNSFIILRLPTLKNYLSFPKCRLACNGRGWDYEFWIHGIDVLLQGEFQAAVLVFVGMMMMGMVGGLGRDDWSARTFPPHMQKVIWK